jgi:hypothetical protein
MQDISEESSDGWELIDDEVLPGDSASRPQAVRASRRTTTAENDLDNRDRRQNWSHIPPPADIDDGWGRQRRQPYSNGHPYYNNNVPYLAIPRPYMVPSPYPVYHGSYHPPPPGYNGTTAPPPPPPPPPPLVHSPYYQPSSHPTEKQRVPSVPHNSKTSFFAPKPSATTIPDKSMTISGGDPIKIVEEYLESLKGTKEKELLEANRILTWIDRHFR